MFRRRRRLRSEETEPKGKEDEGGERKREADGERWKREEGRGESRGEEEERAGSCPATSPALSAGEGYCNITTVRQDKIIPGRSYVVKVERPSEFGVLTKKTGLPLTVRSHQKL